MKLMPSSTKSLFHFKCFNEIFLKYIKQDYMKEFYLSRNCMCMLYHTFFFPSVEGFPHHYFELFILF